MFKAVLAIFTFPVRLVLKILIAILTVVLDYLNKLVEKKYTEY